MFLREGKGNAGLEITDYKACGPGWLRLAASLLGALSMGSPVGRGAACPPSPANPATNPRACFPDRARSAPTQTPNPRPRSRAEHFKYRPRRGDALLFYSLDPALKIDPRSLHGGCPVKRGEVRRARARRAHAGGGPVRSAPRCLRRQRVLPKRAPPAMPGNCLECLLQLLTPLPPLPPLEQCSRGNRNGA